ncbi:MAG: class II aldolase/adducin family protein [Treponema sp.]|jgi:L-fuculose-phosphate aldolase|nr:class II aldolase/adducin family protein [Treponema sp.]
MDIQIIKDILTVCKRLDQKGLVNAYEGNISVRKDGLIYITPAGKNKAFLDEEMICVLEEKTLKQIGGKFPPSSEVPLHVNAFQTRADIGAVIHAHPPYLTAFALDHRPVETKAYPEMMGNFKKIPVAPYGRPGTPDIFEPARELIKKYDGVLLSNHGVLVVGKDVYSAMNKAEAMEAIARVLSLAEQIGKPVDLPGDECAFFLAK